MYDSDHVYLTFGGTGPMGEIWQTGCRFAAEPAGAGIASIWDSWSLADTANAIKAWWTSASSLFAPDLRLTWVKAAHINQQTHYGSEPREYEFLPAAAPLTNTSLPRQSLQTAIVVSLRSGETLGKANYGRMYLPAPCVSRTLNEGGISVADRGNIATDVGIVLGNVQGELSTINQSFKLAIFAQTAAGIGSTHKLVTNILVGSVFDTQRRRRNAIPETYTGVVYNPGNPY